MKTESQNRFKGKLLSLFITDDYKFVMEVDTDAEDGRWFHLWCKNKDPQQDNQANDK
jgi:hypothetical protein